MASLVEKRYLLPPALCILCEQSPVEDASLADTARSLVTGFPNKLEGVKYVCEGCAADVAKAFGFEQGTRVDQAEQAKVHAEGRLNQIRDHVIELAENLKADALDKVANTAPAIVSDAAAKAEADNPAPVDNPSVDRPVDATDEQKADKGPPVGDEAIGVLQGQLIPGTTAEAVQAVIPPGANAEDVPYVQIGATAEDALASAFIPPVAFEDTNAGVRAANEERDAQPQPKDSQAPSKDTSPPRDSSPDKSDIDDKDKPASGSSKQSQKGSALVGKPKAKDK